jgi:hypothetical protein
MASTRPQLRHLPLFLGHVLAFPFVLCWYFAEALFRCHDSEGRSTHF